MVKMISNEECRLQITELVAEVEKTDVPIDVHPVAGKPRYQLTSKAGLDSDRLRTCVAIGPDKFRRFFPEIRGLALFDDIPFGLVIRGELTAIFQRHPSYRPAIVDEVRAEFASRQGKAPPDLISRVSVLEAQVKALTARLDEQPAVGSSRPRRPTPYKRPPG